MNCTHHNIRVYAKRILSRKDLNTLSASARSSHQQDHYLSRGSAEYKRGSLALFAAGLATFAVLYCVQPLFPVFTKTMNLTPAAASITLSVSTILLAISLPIAGFISDRVGRKSLMSISLVISSICCLLTALAPNYGSLLIIRAFQGIVLAGLPAIAMTYLSEEMEPKSLGFAMGLYISGNTVGGLFGRISVGTITDLSSWRWAIGVLAMISLIASIYFWRHLPASRHFTPKKMQPKEVLSLFAAQFHDKGLVCLFILGGVLMGGFVTMYNYLGYRLSDAPYHLSQTVLGWIFILYLVGTFSSTFMGKLSDRLGRSKVLWINLALMLFGILVTLSSHLLLILFGAAVVTFAFFGAHSTASSWVGSRAKLGKAQASSLYLLFYYVGSSLGGTVGGLFWSRAGWTGIVDMISILLLIAMFVSLELTVVLPKKAPHLLK
ncbi:Inner membrane transport protein YnfM [compost metagenome]